MSAVVLACEMADTDVAAEHYFCRAVSKPLNPVGLNKGVKIVFSWYHSDSC